jgi:uncharacterized protein YndB with AHSA1/START domain
VVTATVHVPRTPEHCFRVFTNAELLAAWVPSLRRARVIAAGDDGRPTEILFEFARSLSYSLVYQYDADALVVSWEPRIGKRDAVRGRATFDPFDGGTRLTYALELGDARAASEDASAVAREIADAFRAWMLHEPGSVPDGAGP